jgi:hypothetical protein
MTKASISRVQRRCAKGEIRKKRNEYVYATTEGEVSQIGITIDPQTNEIVFNTPVKNTYAETNFDRLKGPKVINRIPVMPEALQLNRNDALFQNYDVLVGIDTNTQIIGGQNSFGYWHSTGPQSQILRGRGGLGMEVPLLC